MHPTDDREEAQRQYEIAKKLLKEFENDPDAEEDHFVTLFGRARRRRTRTRKFRRFRNRLSHMARRDNAAE
jgi:hypothetical protein